MFSIIHRLTEWTAYDNEVEGVLPGNFVQLNRSLASSHFPNQQHSLHCCHLSPFSVFSNTMATLAFIPAFNLGLDSMGFLE